MPPPVRSRLSDAQLISRVREKMLSHFERAAETSWHALELGIDLVQLRGRLGEARLALATDDPSHAELEFVLREAQLASLRNPERLTATANRAELVRAWTELLVEATEKVGRDRADAQSFAAVAGKQSADDRAWVDAAGAAGQRWKED